MARMNGNQYGVGGVDTLILDKYRLAKASSLICRPLCLSLATWSEIETGGLLYFISYVLTEVGNIDL